MMQKVPTSEGIAVLIRRSRRYMKEHGIEFSEAVMKESWYIQIRRDVMAPEHEGRYWKYIERKE